MENWSFHTIFNLMTRPGSCFVSIWFLLLIQTLPACDNQHPDAASDPLLNGTISYPFVRSNPLGVNGKPEKFIIRSIRNGTEYVIEIPDAGDDYDIEIPTASLSDADASGTKAPGSLPPTARTDRELTSSLPNMGRELPSESALVDKAFGVGPSGGPEQAPSYILGIAKVSEFYKKKQFEYALIEVNHLLSFFPQSPRLHKMKGTIYIRLNDLSLARKSWGRALELQPADRSLRSGIDRLDKRIRAEMDDGADSAATMTEDVTGELKKVPSDQSNPAATEPDG